MTIMEVANSQLNQQANHMRTFQEKNNTSSFQSTSADVKENTGTNEPKGPPQACLFVASLANETREETLANFFGDYGKVLKIKLLKDRSSRPYAFVQYQNVEEADNALEQTNGKTLDNRRLRVEKAKVNRTLFLAKLAKEMSNTQLREAVEAYGPVESVTIIKNHQTNKSKGCGFVKFVYREDAIEAFVGLKSKQRKWVVEWATSTNDPDLLGVDKCNIFVGGLNPQKIEKELLEQRFSAYGDIESITLINRNGSSGDKSGSDSEDQDGGAPRSAFAFVRYKDLASSASAIENENGTEWLDKRIRVQYCESQEMKNKRRANKYFQMNSPYYPGMQLSPMMMMNGMPIYNLPPIPSGKFSPYGKLPVEAPDLANNLYNSVPYAPYPMFAGPWLYAPQMPLENQIPSPERQLSPDGTHGPYESEQIQGVGDPLAQLTPW